MRDPASDSRRSVKQHSHTAIIDFIAPTDAELREIDGEQVAEALTERGFATALDASLSTGIPVAASADLAERFGLADHTERSAEFADFFPADLKATS